MSFLSFLRRPKVSQEPVERRAQPTISETEIYRYRQQRGVNLGSWFVLERWICDEPFKLSRSPGQSDLDIALGDNAKQILERHWDSWITEADWEWISQRGINAVRIPIGYYHICGADPSILTGTDFQPHYEVYAGAWSRITEAIKRAASYNIGVLIDLHAAPGKQNNDSHAGTSNPANFFNDPHNQHRTIDALCALATHLNEFAQSFTPPLANIIGIELLNEPSPPSDHALQHWYTAAISRIRKIDGSIPIYLGECWRTQHYADFVSKNPSPALTVLDHHLYRCFTSEDIHTSAADHTHAISDPSGWISRMLAQVSEKAGRAGGGVVVGEWSGALNPGSLRGVPGEQKNYVSAQLALFERCCAGWFFWTYKKEKKGDTGWSFRDAVENGVFPDLVGIKPRDNWTAGRDKVRDRVRKLALDAHVNYWSKYPGSRNHSLFDSGFRCGWDDAYQFIVSSRVNGNVVTVSQLGFVGAWARRTGISDGLDPDNQHYWEFEHGFIQGVKAATSDYVDGKI